MKVIGKITLCLSLLFANSVASGTQLVTMKNRGDMLGWEAVGRLDLADGGFCTAVLIASDQVLTAAHCLYDADTRKPRDARNAVFRAGYLNGDALTERRVEKYVIAKGYVNEGGKATERSIPRDVALLKLDSPIFSSEANPFLVHSGTEDVTHVQVMSYGRGRSQAMSWQRQCNKVGQYKTILEFDCDTTFGSSGAPVFVRHGGRVRILSLVSGGTNLKDGSTRVFGMELQEVVSELKREMRGENAVVNRVGTGAKRITVGGSKRAGGARFVKVGQ